MNRNIFIALAVGFVLGAAVTTVAGWSTPTPRVEAERAQPALGCAAVAAPSVTAVGAVSAVLKPETSRGYGSAEIENKLRVLLEEPFPQGRQIVRNDRDDGGIATLEQTEDGASINRTFSAKGELRSEGLFSLSGEQVERSYFEPGKLKGFSWIRPDGSRIDIKLRTGGQREGRQDTLVSGEKIITKYDEYGEVREKWRVLKNGRQISL